MIIRNCPIENCENKAYNQTICKKHWYQVNKFGQPVTTHFDQRELIEEDDHLKVQLWNKNGLVTYALIDKEDAWINEHKWNYSDTGYAQTGSHSQKMHRLIMKVTKDQTIDHINGDKLDNRKSNLRLCTIADNNYNRGKQSNNTTGYKGVYRRGSKWVAKINKNRKQIHLGQFDSPKDAAKAYDSGALIHFGDFAKLNFERNN
jgi:hypothetical protein